MRISMRIVLLMTTVMLQHYVYNNGKIVYNVQHHKSFFLSFICFVVNQIIVVPTKGITNEFKRVCISRRAHK
jgi:hypothetical protein